MKQSFTVLALAALVGLAGTAGADETTFCNHFITTLPYTISTQGHYCFDRNLATAITSGNAITINSDFVVLDLNNFKLGGGSAGLGTATVGISAINHRNITIRNGNIRGFRSGILIGGPSSGGHIVENNVLDGNTLTGAEVNGDTVVIRNNIVANTGGTDVFAYGISSDGGQLTTVRDNTVSNTFGTGTGFGYAVGIWATGYGQVVDHNVIRMGSPSSTGYTFGIWAGDAICRDDTVLNATNANRNCTNVGANFP